MKGRSAPVWSIDIGSYAVKAVRMQNLNGVPTVTDFDIIFHPQALTTKDPVERLGQVREALQELMSRHDFSKCKACVAVPGQTAFTRTIPLPPVDPSKLHDIVKFEARQQIPFPIEEVVWDYQQLDETPEGELQVSIFAIREETIQEFLAGFQAVGLEVDLVQIAPIALGNFVSCNCTLQGPTVVIDIGGQNTDLVVMDGRQFWQRPLPYSGHDITKALEQKFQIPYKDAEDLKKNVSSSAQADRIFKVMEPTMRDLVGEVQRSLGYYKSRSGSIKFHKLVMMGNSCRLYGLTDFVGKALKLDTEFIHKVAGFDLGPAVDQGAFHQALPTLGVVLGLALQGCGHAAVDINLLPAGIQKAKEARRKQPLLCVAAASLFCAVLLAWFSAVATVRTLERVQKSGEDMKKKVAAETDAYRRAYEDAARVVPVLRHYAQYAESHNDVVLHALDVLAGEFPAAGDGVNLKLVKVAFKQGDGKTHRWVVKMVMELEVDAHEDSTVSLDRLSQAYLTKLENHPLSAKVSLKEGERKRAVHKGRFGRAKARVVDAESHRKIYVVTFKPEWYIGPIGDVP